MMFNFIRLMAWALVLVVGLSPYLNLQTTTAIQPVAASMSQKVEPNTISYEVKLEKANRVEKLQKFLESYDSPLAEYAEVFVDVADKYDLDWKLLPAIAGMESTFGKRVLENSFNPFGWGGGYACFESWEAAIEAVGSELYERVVAKYGQLTVGGLGPSYCPPNYRNWIAGVNSFIWELDQTALDQVE